MTNSSQQWWYALIAASPRPETSELVNIGLLLGDGGPSRVEFLLDLPRLTSLVAQDELTVFAEIMEGLRQAAAEGMDINVLRQVAGPQLRIGEPRHLYVEPDDSTVRSLVKGLLESPRKRRAQAEQRIMRSKTEHELDRLIGGVVTAVGLRVERRPTLQKLYEDLPPSITEARLPSLSRALRSQRRDVLLDSVLVEEHDPLAAIRIATTRVGRAFWYYKRLRAHLEKTSGREVRTIGVLLNGVPHKSSQVTEAREYINHIWSQDADLVVDVERKEDLAALRKQMQWLAE
jgi:hypothetical protein